MNFDVLNKALVVESCNKIIHSSAVVNLGNDKEFKEAVELLSSSVKSFNAFNQWKSNKLNPQIWNDDAIEWIFLCDLLNFSFWRDEAEDEYEIEFEGITYKGYWTLPAAINRALTTNATQVTSPEYYSKITREQFDFIFRSSSTKGKGKIPLSYARIRVMHEAGKVLLERYNKAFVNFLKYTGTDDAWHFVRCLIKEFPSFRDYDQNTNTYFLKRAQILVADFWACSNGLLFSKTIHQLTIFADYRIPQVLSVLNIIKYEKSLEVKLQNHILLLSGSPEEIEIRAASIIACEKLLSLLGDSTTAVELDYFLWEYSQTIKDKIDHDHPYHRTRWIFY